MMRLTYPHGVVYCSVISRFVVVYYKHKRSNTDNMQYSIGYFESKRKAKSAQVRATVQTIAISFLFLSLLAWSALQPIM